MRISDWSSDVCSSDLVLLQHPRHFADLEVPGPGRYHRSHLRRAARQEHLLEIRQFLRPDRPFDHFDAALARKPDHRLPGQAVEEAVGRRRVEGAVLHRSEEHTSELQSLMCISYAGFCLKQKNNKANTKQ